MSNMLEQAIVDAKALREAAVKSAESELLEKYADEMKQAVTSLLEAEADLGLGAEPAPPADVPPAYADGENVCPCPDEGQEMEIDFSELRAQAEEAEDAGEDDGLGMGLGGEEELGGGLGDELGGEEEGGLGLGGEEEGEEEEELTLQEQEMLEKIFSEDVILDMMKEAEEEDESGDDEEEGDDEESEESEAEDVDALKAGFQAREESLMRTIARLSEKLKKETKSNKKYKNVISKVTGRLAEVNLSNAKLLYTNRVLNNTSLNERQKNKIVESIGKAGSVDEAKTIFDTLQNAVSGTSSRNGRTRPNTLSEAVRRNSSPYTIRGNGKEPQQTDAFSERMRRLAGITK